jgi:hypothetical protein
MGSLRFEGVRFSVYSEDHLPPHVHGFYAEVEVVVDLLMDGAVALSKRRNAITPTNSSRADVNYVLELAAKHHGQLLTLWRGTHG